MVQSKASPMVSTLRTDWLPSSISLVVVMCSVASTCVMQVSTLPSRMDANNIPTYLAPPFHPEGERPKESCPVCMQEAGDETPRDLYSIRGFEKDEHDPMIPAIWFDVPPAKLNEKGEEMEALRVRQRRGPTSFSN